MANRSFKLKNMWSAIKPPVILMLICLVCSGLVVVAYNATYIDTTGVITEKLQEGCEEVLGAGSFTMLTTGKGEEATPVTYKEGVNSIITDDKGQAAIEVTVNGYAKDGIHLLVGIDAEGAVRGVHILSLGETPGLGTKVDSPAFLEQFLGSNGSAAPDAITGATFSSSGVSTAVNLAMSVYIDKKGEILGE